jgi:hypothetical protein
VLSVILARTPEVRGWTLPVIVRPSTWAKRRTGPGARTVEVLLVKTTFRRRARCTDGRSDPPVTLLPVTVTSVDGRAGGAVGGEEEADIPRRQAVAAHRVVPKRVEGVHFPGIVGLDVEDEDADPVEAVLLDRDAGARHDGDAHPPDVAERVVVDPDRVGRDLRGDVRADVDAVAPGMADRVVGDFDVRTSVDEGPIWSSRPAMWSVVVFGLVPVSVESRMVLYTLPGFRRNGLPWAAVPVALARSVAPLPSKTRLWRFASRIEESSR